MKKKLLFPLMTVLLFSTPSLGTEGAPQVIYEETSEDSFEECIYQLDMTQAQLLSSIDDLEGKVKELEKLKAKQVKIMTDAKKILDDPKLLEKPTRTQLLTLMNEAAQKSADYEKQIQTQRQQIEQNQKEVENIKVQLSLIQLEKERAEKEQEIENLSRQLYQMQLEKEEAERKRKQEEQKPVSRFYQKFCVSSDSGWACEYV